MLSASLAHAQAAGNNDRNNNLGELDDFKGPVMVLQDKNYANAVKDMKLYDGDRVIVLDKAEAVVYITTRGQRCRIEIKENHTFTVRDKQCEALILSVEAVTPAVVPGATTGTVAGITDTGVAAIAAGAVGVAAIIGWNHPKGSPD
ncbi:MAG: hypothetical protein JSR18_03045 [Proteobacteria bacterium]|nr:hypothetical protein [Pseudomonadota bacterium]